MSNRSDTSKDFEQRLMLSDDDVRQLNKYRKMSEKQLRKRAEVAANYWIHASSHEHTYLDGQVNAEYVFKAIRKIERLEKALKKRKSNGSR